jgi:hypothetical protein
MDSRQTLFWDISDLMSGFDNTKRKYYQRARKWADTVGNDMVKYVQANGPWTDRTGNLRAHPYYEKHSKCGGQYWSIAIVHGEEYGYWLENYFNKRFAILEDTINWEYPRSVELLRDLVCW